MLSEVLILVGAVVFCVGLAVGCLLLGFHLGAKTRIGVPNEPPAVGFRPKKEEGEPVLEMPDPWDAAMVDPNERVPTLDERRR